MQPWLHYYYTQMQSKSQRFFEKIYCRFENKHDNDYIRGAGRGENVVKRIFFKTTVPNAGQPSVIVLPREDRGAEPGAADSAYTAETAADIFLSITKRNINRIISTDIISGSRTTKCRRNTCLRGARSFYRKRSGISTAARAQRSRTT